ACVSRRRSVSASIQKEMKPWARVTGAASEASCFEAPSASGGYGRPTRKRRIRSLAPRQLEETLRLAPGGGPSRAGVVWLVWARADNIVYVSGGEIRGRQPLSRGGPPSPLREEKEYSSHGETAIAQVRARGLNPCRVGTKPA